MPESDHTAPGEQDVFLKIESGAHTAEITQIIVSSDGKFLVSCAQDKSIRVWDAASLKEVRKILGWIEADESGQIQSIALSPDDRYLVAVVRVEGWEGILRLHDFHSGKLLKTFNPHPEHAPGTGIIKFSPDGKYLICAEGRAIKIWTFADVLAMDDPQPITTIEAFRPQEVCYFTTGGERRLVWVELNDSGGCILYSLDKKVRLNDFKPPVRYVTPDSDRRSASFFVNVAVSQKYIAVNGDYSYVWIFDHDLNPVTHFPQTAEYPNSIWSQGNPAGLAFSPDGKLLLIGARNPAHISLPVQARVYDVTSGFKPGAASGAYDTPASAVAFLDDKTAFSAGGSRSEINVWDAYSGEAKGHICGAGKIPFTVGMRDGVIAFGNTRESEDTPAPFERSFSLVDYSFRELSPSEAQAFSPIPAKWEHYHLGIPPDNDNLFLFDPSGRIPLTGSSGMYHANIGWYGATVYGFTDQGEILIASRGGPVYLLARNGDYRAILEGHRGFVYGMAFWKGAIGKGQERNWLVTSGEDQTIRLWNLDEIPAETDPGAPPEFEPALNLFVAHEAQGMEWILWSQSGHYDASLGGDCYVGYHVNQGKDGQASFYPSDRFIKELYRPHIIRCILDMGSLEFALSDAHLEKPKIASILPPGIELIGPAQRSTDKDSIKVKFEVTPAADPVERVWVLCNDNFAWQSQKAIKSGKKRFSAKLQLTPGENRIKILAESRAAKSNPIPLVVVREPPPRRKTKRDSEEKPQMDSLRVRLDLAGQNDHLRGIRLLRNGSVVWEQAGEALDADGTISIPVEHDAAEGEYSLQADLHIPAEADLKNMLSISVARSPSDEGGEASEDAEKSRGDGKDKKDKPQDEQIKPNLYLLAVGVSKLAHPLPQLNIVDLDAADADARAIVEKFDSQGDKRYARVISRLLLNEDATRENIYKALAELEKAIQKRQKEKTENGLNVRDVTLIFLAGHGVQNPATGDYYFWTHDFDRDELPDTGIHLIDFGLRVTSLPTELIIMTDACRSGLVGSEIIRNLDPEALAKRLIALNETAQIIFNATEKDTSSFEKNGHGYFTRGILDSLDDRDRRSIPVLWLIDNVQEKVTKFSRGRQVPTARFYGDIYRDIIYER